MIKEKKPITYTLKVSQSLYNDIKLIAGGEKIKPSVMIRDIIKDKLKEVGTLKKEQKVIITD